MSRAETISLPPVFSNTKSFPSELQSYYLTNGGNTSYLASLMGFEEGQGDTALGCGLLESTTLM